MNRREWLQTCSAAGLASALPASARTLGAEARRRQRRLDRQPMPAHMFEETKYVRSKVHLPIFADEPCTNASEISKLREAYDGINVKLDKSGGILEAYHWIKIARALDMKVMLGCMISSSCPCTAAAHLSPLVDFADLDGFLLIANDPFTGVKVEKGKLSSCSLARVWV